MEKEEFIAWIRHFVWCGFMTAAGQDFNEKPTTEQWSSLMQGVHYAEQNPNNSPEQNHENWMKVKLENGWTYGPKKDIVKKEHHDLVPYADLEEIERLKDDMDLMAHKMARELWEKAEVRDWLASYKLNAHDLGVDKPEKVAPGTLAARRAFTEVLEDPVVTKRSCISCGTILVPTIDEKKGFDGNWTCPNAKCPRGWLLTASFNVIEMELRKIEHHGLSSAQMDAIHDRVTARAQEKNRTFLGWCKLCAEYYEDCNEHGAMNTSEVLFCLLDILKIGKPKNWTPIIADQNTSVDTVHINVTARMEGGNLQSLAMGKPKEEGK